MEQDIKNIVGQMAKVLEQASKLHLQDVAGYGFQLVDDLKRMEGVTPEEAADIDKMAAELQTKTTELQNVRNSYK